MLLKESEIIRQETDQKLKSFLTEQEVLYKVGTIPISLSYVQFIHQVQLEKLETIENEKQSLNEQLQATMEEKSLEEKVNYQLSS